MASYSEYTIPPDGGSQTRATLLAHYRAKLAEDASRRNPPVIDVEARKTAQDAGGQTQTGAQPANQPASSASTDLRSRMNSRRFPSLFAEKAKPAEAENPLLYKPPDASTGKIATSNSPRQRGMFVDLFV